MKSSILYKHILIPRKLVLGSSLKCSDKFWSKLLRKKANQHSWDSTWTECSGIAKANRWPFHPVIDILSKVWCNWILSLSGSGSEGSDGMHPIMMYVNTRVGLGQPPSPRQFYPAIQNILLLEVWCNRILSLSGSCSEGSEGCVDARLGPG